MDNLIRGEDSENIELVIAPLIRKASIQRKTLYDSARKIRIGEMELLNVIRSKVEGLLEILNVNLSPNTQVAVSIGNKLLQSIAGLEIEILAELGKTIIIRPDINYDGMFNDLRKICSIKKLSDEQAELIYNFCGFITKTLGVVNRHSLRMIMELIADCIITDSPVTLFTANSKSIDPSSKILRTKPQYYTNEHLNEAIKIFLKSNSSLKIEYVCVLPDFDATLPTEQFDELWQMNLLQIQSYTSASCIRLSTMIEAPNIKRDEITKVLEVEIADFSKKQSTLIEFEASEDFVANQIVSYTIAGLLLEQALPQGILLDIQKRSYPFEQSYYSRLRKKPLPIVYCGQKVGDPL